MGMIEDGEQLAVNAWRRRGPKIVLDKAVYGKEAATIKDAEVRRGFDRKLGQIAADSRLILRPKLPKRKKVKQQCRNLP
jgi:hypothetical protein